MSKNHKS